MKVVLMLGAFLPFVSAHGATAPMETVPVVVGAQTFDVKVSSANQRAQLASLDDPDVLQVSQVLGPMLGSIGDPGTAPAVVAGKLQVSYPGLVSLQSTMLKYIYEWCPEHGEWVRICCDLEIYEVRLATTVRVDVEVVTTLSSTSRE